MYKKVRYGLVNSYKNAFDYKIKKNNLSLLSTVVLIHFEMTMRFAIELIWPTSTIQ